MSPVWHLLALQRGGEGGGRALSTCAPLCPRRTGLWEGLTHACERSAFHFQHLFKTLCVGLSVSSRDSQKAHSPVGEKNVRYFSTRFAFLAPKDFSLTLFPKLSPSLPSSMKFECHRCTVSILIGLCIPVLSNEESKIFPTLVCQEGLLSALGGLSLRGSVASAPEEERQAVVAPHPRVGDPLRRAPSEETSGRRGRNKRSERMNGDHLAARGRGSSRKGTGV